MPTSIQILLQCGMKDAELDAKLAELEELVNTSFIHTTLSFASLKKTLHNVPKVIELSLALTREVIRRVKALEEKQK